MRRSLILTRPAIVTDVWLVCVIAIAVGLSCPAAFALDPMGPPRASVREGQFSIGTDLSYSKTDQKLINGKWTNPNADPTSGDPGGRKLKDFETTKLYCTAGYGFAENWEAFLGIGATKAEFGDDLWDMGEDFDSGIGLGIRGGVKATILELPDYDLQIGGLIQIDWANYDGKLDSSQWPAPDFVEVDLTGMQIAVGATYWWEDGFTVYGGPFVHYIEGNLEQYTADGFDLNWDIDEGPIWGIYLGALVDIARNCVLNIELQHSSNANLFGAGLMLTY